MTTKYWDLKRQNIWISAEVMSERMCETKEESAIKKYNKVQREANEEDQGNTKLDDIIRGTEKRESTAK